jgi:hypothetical protein
MMKVHTNRKAIAMIELIFAIAIMGIALMSAPTLISQSSSSTIGVVQQEAIAAGATEINMILTRAWDENNTNDINYNPILITNENASISALTEATDTDGNGTGKRVGTPREASRGFITSSGQRLNASAIGIDGNDGGIEDDIDDFDNANISLTNIETTDTQTGDYIDNTLTMAVNIEYINSPNITYHNQNINLDSPFSNINTVNTTNIKSISVRVTSDTHSSVLDTDITLKAFMCNIGSYKLNRRAF